MRDQEGTGRTKEASYKHKLILSIIGMPLAIYILFLQVILSTSLPVFVLTIIDDESSPLPRLFLDPPIYNSPTCCIWTNVDCTHWETGFKGGILHLFSTSHSSTSSLSIPLFILSSYIIVNGGNTTLIQQVSHSSYSLYLLLLSSLLFFFFFFCSFL